MEKICYDHLGNQYQSFTQMCKAYNIDLNTVYSRLRRRWTLEKALTEKVTEKTVYDHLGNRYESFKQMCNNYNKKVQTVITRLKNGWSLERALTEKIDTKEGCYDHLENRYNSFRKMCKAYNQDYTTVRKRIIKGWTLEKALTEKPEHSNKPKVCYDHLGNSYKSFNKMCEAYGIERTVVESRLENGWSLEKALTKDRKTQQISINVFGNEYSSISRAVNEYSMRLKLVLYRLKSKWDIELAFVYPTTSPKIYFDYVGIDGKTRYKLGKNIYTTGELIDKYAPEYSELYKKTNPQGIHHLFDRCDTDV